jgi:hypothetical protein
MPNQPMPSKGRSAVRRVVVAIAVLFLLIVIVVLVLLVRWNPNPHRVVVASRTDIAEPTASMADLTGFNARRDYVTSSAVDLHGRVWLGTESDGVWRFDPYSASGSQWTQFTTANGLGDNTILAIACDGKGRIWAGHRNHGVSVCCGDAWKNYDVVGGLTAVKSQASVCGPLGDHVPAIKICPVDGDVWMATSAGIARYSAANDSWDYLNRAQGLPCDQVNAIAFDRDGNVIVATPCDGVAMADAKDHYSTWRQSNGPIKASSDSEGEGLPINLVNDVLIAGNGTMYAATSMGLAWSFDHGKTWRFVRGEDWADKVQNSAAGPPAGWDTMHGDLLAEDYTTCLGEESDGSIDVGYREKGWSKVTPKADGMSPVAGAGPGYVRCFSSAGSVRFAGTWGEGVLSMKDSSATVIPVESQPSDAAPANFPSPPTVPTADDLHQMLAELADVPPMNADDPLAICLADDWRTQGDWIGRYGRYWAIICAICGGPDYDYRWGAGPVPIQYALALGDHQLPGDAHRYYCAQLYTKDPRTLEIPPVYMHSRVVQHLTSWEVNRRQAEWNDNSYDHPINFEGPDLYFTMAIPDGVFVMSFYELNDDYKVGNNYRRDLELIVKSSPAAPPDDLGNSAAFDALPTLACARVSDFTNGVYKRFLVRGPMQAVVKVCRNYSTTTKVSGVFLDLPDERPMPYFCSVSDWEKSQQAKAQLLAEMRAQWTSNPQEYKKRFTPPSDESAAAVQLLNDLEIIRDWNPRWWAINHQRIAVAVARWYQNQSVAGKLNGDAARQQATSLYESGIYPAWEAAQTAAGDRPARDIEKALRWDQSIPAYSGRGYKTITEYLAKQPGVTNR